MKQIINTVRALSAIALLALAAGCATTTQDKESALIAAGFKVLTPNSPAQEAKLQSLPLGKVTMVQKKGKTYYVFPDLANNRVYVGTPTEYQAYQQQRQAQQLADEQLELAAEQNAEMNFETWNGWGPGFGPGPGPGFGPGPHMMPPPPMGRR